MADWLCGRLQSGRAGFDSRSPLQVIRMKRKVKYNISAILLCALFISIALILPISYLLLSQWEREYREVRQMPTADTKIKVSTPEATSEKIILFSLLGLAIYLVFVYILNFISEIFNLKRKTLQKITISSLTIAVAIPIIAMLIDPGMILRQPLVLGSTVVAIGFLYRLRKYKKGFRIIHKKYFKNRNSLGFKVSVIMHLSIIIFLLEVVVLFIFLINYLY